MPVREVKNNVRVESNHVYVIPPNTSLSIVEGHLKLQPRYETGGAHRSIDFFFESLAQDQRERSIGVILSGTATDGTLGLEAIKAEGGITFAQDDSAKYDSMPRSAAAAGCVDFVLSPEEIAMELARIAKHPYIVGHPAEPGRPENDRASATAQEEDDKALPSGGSGSPNNGAEQARAEAKATRGGSTESAFKKILLLLRNHCGVDFSLYKSTTIQRRITRRMVLSKEDTLEDYAKFLRGNAHELDALYSDCLISVTSFFRNPEAFDVLKYKVFPKLLQRRGDDPFRVWVLGCSTGQEAYSIGMAFLESADKAPRMCKLQIFATDLNEALLNKARHGLYAKSLAQDISPERLRRFFVEENGGYRIMKPLREMVVFARQNLVSDAPFSRMDLISCRNLLIYIEPALQRKVMPMFHYALKPEGFLFLGVSESIGAFTDLFEPADKRHKIYSKKAAPTQMLRLPVKKEPGEQQSPKRKLPLSLPLGKQGMPTEFTAQREADRISINQFAPPGVLINSDLQILQFRGPTSAYLQPPSTGKASFDVLKMAKEGLMLPLRAAINKAKKENTAVRKLNVRVQQNGRTCSVNLEVIPLKNLQELCFLVLFHDAEKSGQDAPFGDLIEKRALPPSSKKEQSRRVIFLEQELSETRDYLRSMQEQHEAANEELQASSEEVQSANEELQSINEELETSKEELESANEELTTINEEMASRNTELARLNSDLINLQTSTKLPIIVVGRDLSIRRFSPAAERMFNLLSADLGRSISGSRHNLDLPDLETFIADVISNVREQECEVRDKEGRWYSLRVRPYMTVDNKIDGAVLVLVDITDLKHSQVEVKSAREYAEATIRSARDPLVVLRADLGVNSANEAFYKMFRTTAAQTEGRQFYELGNHQWKIPRLRMLLEEILLRNSFFNDFEVTHEFPDIGRRTMLLNARRLDQEEGTPGLILLAIEDVTERQRISQVTTQLAAIVQSSPDAIFARTTAGVVTSWNPGAELMYGYSAKEILGQNISMLIPDALKAESEKLIEQLLRGEAITNFETEGVRKNGSIVSISLSLAPLLDARTNQLVGASVIARDISERKKGAERVRISEIRYRRLFEAAHDGVLIIDSVSRKITDANPYLLDLLGYTLEELVGKELWQIGLLKDEQSSHAAFREIQQHGLIRYDDLPVQSKSGQTQQVEVVANLYDEDGKKVIQANIRDISQRKASQEALRHAHELLTNEAAHLDALVRERTARLEATIAELEHFSYTITHDMRAPLRSMQGFSGMLLEDAQNHLTPQSTAYLARIINGAHRMDALICDSLQYAKAVLERLPLTAVQPLSILRGILESYPSLQPPDVQLQLVEPFPPVIANEAGLTQCFSNLLVNAVKFVRLGVTPTIRVWAETKAAALPSNAEGGLISTASCIRFWFEDNGIGIPPEYHERIFEMFQQLDRNYVGSGIGLALVRKTAERMGGKAGVESEPGRGSRFWVEFKSAAPQESK